jgi:hypothetical protein
MYQLVDSCFSGRAIFLDFVRTAGYGSQARGAMPIVATVAGLAPVPPETVRDTASR